MGNIWKTLGDYLWPVIFGLSGLFIIYMALFGGQNGYWLFGGTLVVLVSLFMLLMKLEVLGGSAQKLLLFVFLPLSVVSAFFCYRSIMDRIEFNVLEQDRRADVIAALKDLRAAQMAYRSEHQHYTSDFDSLIHFIESEQFRVVKAIGRVPDSLTEAQALAAGIIKRDTILVGVRDSLFKERSDLQSIRFIPHSEKVPFSMRCGKVMKGAVEVPVFEVVASYKDIFAGIEAVYYDPEKELRVGSMDDPSTSGNWE